jgi:hypothetical protein
MKMAEKKGNWNDTPNIFVAFLDIMGFRDRVFREIHGDIRKMLESLRPAIEVVEKEAKERLQKQILLQKKNKALDTNSPLVFPVSFSDSIILFSSDDSKDSIQRIIIDAEYIFHEAIQNEIPMKGAIAFGEMTVDTTNSLYFGKPLIDAYELHKELQMYGVVLHHTAQRRFEELRKELILDDLVAGDYPVPMKSSKIHHHLLDWTIFCENPENLVKKLYNSVSGTTRLYVDNTLEFLDWLEKEKAKREQQKKALNPDI